jgi:Cys-tRNA(Pro) deacylase
VPVWQNLKISYFNFVQHFEIILSKNKIPVTPAIRLLRSFNAVFTAHEYDYEEKGGTLQTSLELGVSEHDVVKTLILDADGEIICMLMHGDKEVSLKELARIMGVKKIEPCSEKIAMNATGYQFGGTSPFGTKKQLPVYAQATIFELERIYINGGKRGLILEISPKVVMDILNPEIVDVAI